MSQAIPLHQYLDASLVSVNSSISSRKKLLQFMAEILASALPPSSEENIEKEVYHALLEREKLGNTGIGNGIAIPHTRLNRADRAILALVTLDEPIDYDSIDRQDVDIAFGLIVPQEASQEHLNILATIARSMAKQERRQELLAATSSEQAIHLIQNWPTQAG